MEREDILQGKLPLFPEKYDVQRLTQLSAYDTSKTRGKK